MFGPASKVRRTEFTIDIKKMIISVLLDNLNEICDFMFNLVQAWRRNSDDSKKRDDSFGAISFDKSVADIAKLSCESMWGDFTTSLDLAGINLGWSVIGSIGGAIYNIGTSFNVELHQKYSTVEEMYYYLT